MNYYLLIPIAVLLFLTIHLMIKWEKVNSKYDDLRVNFYSYRVYVSDILDYSNDLKEAKEKIVSLEKEHISLMKEKIW